MIAHYKGLTDAEWVLKAASKDEARPVLTALYVNDSELVATDGHRLHLTARKRGNDGFACGLWSDTPGQQIQGNFPDYWKVFPTISELRSLDVYGALPVIEAALAYAKARNGTQATVTLPADDGQYVACGAGYLKDILLGRLEGHQSVKFQAPGTTTPITVFVYGFDRVAVLMPVRRTMNAAQERDPRFDLSDFCELPEIAHNNEALRSNG